MESIFNNGVANHIGGIEKIGPEKKREIEPAVAGTAGIWVPCTGNIDFAGATNKMAELVTAMQPLSKIILGEEVTGIGAR